MWDVERPRHPRLLATTGRAGGAGDASGADGYNDFIHHNSFRPNAAAFTPNSAPSLRNGNILLVTEEDYEQTDCTQAGSFQTWHVKRLDGGAGGIVPLDKVELSDLGSYPLPQGAFCSAHWFDYRPGGIVAIGYYGGGTQLIDVREPEAAEAVRPRLLGRQRGLGRDVGAALRAGRARRPAGPATSSTRSTWCAASTSTASTCPARWASSRPVPGAPDRSLADMAAASAAPAGLVLGALATTLLVRRRSRRGSTA